MHESRIVTFTTDFGTHDHYAGTMKGVVLSINAAATLVDICHEIASFDVLDGALTIPAAYRFFPAASVHVVVVDPGVGGTRRAIVADTGRHIFVAPDNGVLSFIYERETRVTVRQITNERYFLHPVSNTFHGRDLFAPVAGHISNGVGLDSFGPEISDYVRTSIPAPMSATQGTLSASIVKLDKFGNIVTNITPEVLTATFGAGKPFRVIVRGIEITQFRLTYAGALEGELFALFGSMGLLEIAMNLGSAAKKLEVQRGDSVEIKVL